MTIFSSPVSSHLAAPVLFREVDWANIPDVAGAYVIYDKEEVLFMVEERCSNPNEAKAACRKYIQERCSFSFITAADEAEARDLEKRLKQELRPSLNP